ncbi:MAG: hypothetical protein P8M25_06015 [Paracoccaceae bacterium]|nr:hypothetical protein [Paracoccaceae bacterium]
METQKQLGQDSTFDKVADTLVLPNLQYSEGTRTKHYFVPTDPDCETVNNINSIDQIRFSPYSKFLQIAEIVGKSHYNCPANQLIINEFDTANEHEAIDCVVHISAQHLPTV